MLDFHGRVVWMDGPERYGRISRLLHWAMAALILWQLLGMVLKVIFGREPIVAFFVGMHADIGVSIFGLLCVRVVWAIINRKRRPEHLPGLPGLVVRAGHFLLYLLMLVVPALALLRALGGKRPFEPFGITLNPGRVENVGWMVEPANALHGILAWTLLVVLAGHVGMALLHQLVLRDGLMKRMA